MLLRGEGAAADLVRAKDWKATPLGEPSSWPLALASAVRMMLATKQAMSIFWGPALVNLYNDGFIPLLGEKHPAAMGQRAEECWSDAWPVVGGLLNDVVANGNAVLFQEMLVPIVRSGKLEDAWWNYSYSPLFDDAGAVAGVLVVAIETTDEVRGRRALEAAKLEADLARQEMHSVFMQAPLPMAFLKGSSHLFTLVNAPYRELVTRDVEGKTLGEAFSEAEVGYYRPVLDRVFQTGEPSVLSEAPLSLQNENGVVRERFIDVGYHPYRAADGSIAGVLAVIHDVTSQVVARRRESALREAAEAASRAKDEFLAVVSHELRTPLSAVLGWARMLTSTSEPKFLEKGLTVIERNATAQAKLIDDILDVSRIISGKVVLELKRVRVASIVRNAVESIRPATEAKGIGLALAIADDEMDLVADEARLQQVVWNLLSNAVKFTPADGVIRVRASREGSRITVRVEDTGKGIAADFLPFVFERFRQDESSTTRRFAGLGLGLSIVKHIVELHGGVVEARSEGAGRGSVFEVTLPIRAVEPRVSSERITPEPRANGPNETQRVAIFRARVLEGRRVLVVDDETDARDLVATVLREAGATVTEAASAAEARAVFESASIDALVSDIGMPNEDGYSLIESLRAAGRTIPALALTAFARAQDRDHALAAGFQEHMAKPVDPEALLRAVAVLLQRS